MAIAGEGSVGMLALFIGLAIGISFLCSVLEAVLLSITPSFVATLEESNPSLGARLRDYKDRIDRPLAAILTLNTIAHTVGAAMAGGQAAALFGSFWNGVFTAVFTLAILYFSEIIPKTLGAVYWRGLAGFTGAVLKVIIPPLMPFIWVSEWLAKIVAGGEKASHFSREELGALAAWGHKEGHLEEGESRVVGNMLRFAELKVSDIMTPRTVMFSLPESISVEEVIANHENLPFSRIPVFGENRDEVKGFVLKVDILEALAKDKHDTPLSDLRRELHAIPLTATLSKALDTLFERNAHLLLTVDEYGSTSGLVTLEDTVETLLGMEIVDEADRHVDMQQLARRKWQERAARYGLQIDEKEADAEEAAGGKPDTEKGSDES